MIQVNLLPMHLRPVRRSIVPYLLTAAVVALAVFGMFAVFVADQARLISKNGAKAKLQSELDELKEVIDEYNRLEQTKTQLASKINTIAEITKDRILWSRQLWNMSRLLPDNFWYKNISVDKKSYKESTQVHNPQTKKDETKITTVQQPILRLEGYIARTEAGIADVNPLMAATEANPEFAERFRVEPPSFKDTDFEGVPVREFTLEYIILPGSPAS